MALNKKKREERVLKSDQMIQEAIQRGAVNPETSSKAILGELNKELVKENKTEKKAEEPKSKEKSKPVQAKEEKPAVKETVSPKKEEKKSSKPGRKKIYENDRYLIHIRVDEDLREKIDSATNARHQTMQDYLMALLKEDLEKNGEKYEIIYKSMMELQKDIH